MKAWPLCTRSRYCRRATVLISKQNLPLDGGGATVSRDPGREAGDHASPSSCLSSALCDHEQAGARFPPTTRTGLTKWSRSFLALNLRCSWCPRVASYVLFWGQALSHTSSAHVSISSPPLLLPFLFPLLLLLVFLTALLPLPLTLHLEHVSSLQALFNVHVAFCSNKAVDLCSPDSADFQFQIKSSDIFTILRIPPESYCRSPVLNLALGAPFTRPQTLYLQSPVSPTSLPTLGPTQGVSQAWRDRAIVWDSSLKPRVQMLLGLEAPGACPPQEALGQVTLQGGCLYKLALAALVVPVLWTACYHLSLSLSVARQIEFWFVSSFAQQIFVDF